MVLSDVYSVFSFQKLFSVMVLIYLFFFLSLCRSSTPGESSLCSCQLVLTRLDFLLTYRCVRLNGRAFAWNLRDPHPGSPRPWTSRSQHHSHQ
ncbi:hypothetical protein BDV28DRAFT_78879 [Aspergillus coremiiformis]|uniref:Uncharacterized protein n=1 Tax=Aspergillus coremiiformis TaxID=138285 RepID=A0A5N6YTJ8_9EURO|nr:hypothetical protein BDV28DRAFT_78879 [Aspergillus coremiiformis]